MNEIENFRTSADEIKSLDFSQALSLLEDDFVNEKDFCDFIELNIELFCMMCLNVKYKSHIREYRIEPFAFKKRIHKRIDLVIETLCGKTILIECKTPKYLSENGAAIGQLLHYTSLFDRWRKQSYMSVLLTTKVDPEIIFTIATYQLPILYIAMDKSNFLFSSNKHFVQ